MQLISHELLYSTLLFIALVYGRVACKHMCMRVRGDRVACKHMCMRVRGDRVACKHMCMGVRGEIELHVCICA